MLSIMDRSSYIPTGEFERGGGGEKGEEEEEEEEYWPPGNQMADPGPGQQGDMVSWNVLGSPPHLQPWTL